MHRRLEILVLFIAALTVCAFISTRPGLSHDGSSSLVNLDLPGQIDSDIKTAVLTNAKSKNLHDWHRSSTLR